MEDGRQRTPKDAVTIRLDKRAKAELAQIAATDNRTVSNLVDQAVREYIDKRNGRTESSKLKVRHARLPDTSVFRAFKELAPDQWEKETANLKLPSLDFVPDGAEWSRLSTELFTGQSDIVESVNWLPIFWNVSRGKTIAPSQLYRPYLQVFVGHCIFVRASLAAAHLRESDLEEFQSFRQQATTGKDLSLRSLVGWARDADRRSRLDSLWREAVVACQPGTDYEIAVRRVAPILRSATGEGLDSQIQYPAIMGIVNLDRGFQDFRNGTVDAFSGNLLHSAELLTVSRDAAFLLAGC